MKTALVTIGFALTVALASAKNPTLPQLPAATAATHLGEHAYVDCFIARVSTTSDGRELLDVGAPYPHQSLSIVVPQKRVAHVGDLSHLVGTVVKIRGIIRPGKAGDTKIYLFSRDQIISRRNPS